ncbi:hypothetical protein HOG16_03715 [Candidatus Woesearchaeota archaeon]|jgi:hypothetical protein|nr:hypothetical protein [Candidatus Woesearchaeota archaeon]MBT4321629.1 hypothetical protein [Candidatus Woesearchaeota archaeon]MBT4631060.1 hypothetical protein [Candidatus Woesearchaeota archaeon]
MPLEAFFQTAWGSVVLIFLILWQLPWKGYALWKAARRKEIVWFILIFLINTLAILEIFYIFYVARDHVRKAKKGWKWYRKRKK